MPGDAAHRQPRSAAVEEQRRSRRPQLRAPREVRVERAARLAQERNDALPSALPAHAQRILRDVIEIQAYELRDAQARAVEQLERRPIAQASCASRGGCGDDGEAVVDGDDVGQRDTPLRERQPARRAVCDVTHAHAVLVERPQARLLARQRGRCVGGVAGGEECPQVVARRRIERNPALVEEGRKLPQIGDVRPLGVGRGALHPRQVGREGVDLRIHAGHPAGVRERPPETRRTVRRRRWRRRHACLHRPRSARSDRPPPPAA